MSSPSSYGRSLESTPTWAVAVVVFVLVAISLVLEQILHHVGSWLKKKKKSSLYEALDKIKAGTGGPIYFSIWDTPAPYFYFYIGNFSYTLLPCNFGLGQAKDEEMEVMGERNQDNTVPVLQWSPIQLRNPAGPRSIAWPIKSLEKDSRSIRVGRPDMHSAGRADLTV
ncbi:hypothetical protein RD792_008126 [Penstemon davidsonii]|uniref:Uncharacterized protein n=1 Tax=Penstemon davidsonii TaxID=160366 RepID=A0ABR0D883_9LAMI|nr:hypothetical protein RD792_008126 [Penstemon davidsonii]